MSKAISIAKLDYKTIMPYMTTRTIIIFGILAFFLMFIGGNLMMLVGLAAMLGSMFTGYPFAIGEKPNLDALYVTIGADRENVVLGRYLFAITMFVLSVLAAVIIGAAGSLIAPLFGTEITTEGIGGMIVAVSVLMIIIELVQLPIYFKMPYSKSKFVAFISFGFVGAFMGAFMGFVGSGSYETLIKAAGGFLKNPVLFGLIILAILGMFAIISYSLSVRFYRKREF
jgi:hypothetical protein